MLAGRLEILMSDQIQVEITGMVITNRYGALSSGTVLRTDAAFAKHLVEDCGAAKYIAAEAAQEGGTEVVVKAAPKAKAKKKESDPQPAAAVVPQAAEALPIVEPSASEVAQPTPAAE